MCNITVAPLSECRGCVMLIFSGGHFKGFFVTRNYEFMLGKQLRDVYQELLTSNEVSLSLILAAPRLPEEIVLIHDSCSLFIYFLFVRFFVHSFLRSFI